jgi:hypothetical protein
MFRRHSPEVSPASVAPSYDFLATNNDYDNPDFIEAFRGQYDSQFQIAYQHYFNDPSIAHLPSAKRAQWAAENARAQARFDMTADVENHFMIREASAFSGLGAPEADALKDSYNSYMWTHITMPEETWKGSTDATGNRLNDGVYDELARRVGERDGYMFHRDGRVLEGEDAEVYKNALHLETTRDNLARMLGGKSSRVRAMRRAYEDQYGRKLSKADALALAQDEYKQAKLNYYDAQRAKMLVDPSIASLPVNEQNKHINQQLVGEDLQQFRDLEMKKLAELSDPKMGKLLQFLNRGSLATRFGKNALLGGGLWKAGAILTGATGGILAPAIAASLIGFRLYKSYATWQNRKPSTVDNSNVDVAHYQSELARFTEADLENHDITTIFGGVDIASRVTTEARKSQDRKQKLKSVAFSVGTIMLPSAVLQIDAVQDAANSAGRWIGDRFNSSWDWTKENVYGFDESQADEAKEVVRQAYNPNPIENDIIQYNGEPYSEVTLDSSTPGAVSGSTINEVNPFAYNSTPSVAEFANLDRLLNAQGTYPWNRAVEFFNGDTVGAKNWLETAVSKTPGAEWHNLTDGISTNDWISVNGNSDTNYVWSQLTKSMLSK